MATAANGSLAEAATAFLSRGGNIVPRLRGDTLEMGRQFEQLKEWAQGAGCLIDYRPPTGAPTSRGAEHEVFFDQAKDRVFKRTHAGTAGSIRTSRGIRRTATPYFYLRRLELVNHVFGSDLVLEGVSTDERPSIIISQEWAHPADPENPVPTEAEVNDFMRNLGLEPVPDAPFEWVRRLEAVRVSDARVDNFIKSQQGIIPIDVIVGYEDEAGEA